MKKVDYVKFAIYSIAGGAFYFSLGISLDWILGQSTLQQAGVLFSYVRCAGILGSDIEKDARQQREKTQSRKNEHIK